MSWLDRIAARAGVERDWNQDTGTSASVPTSNDTDTSFDYHKIPYLGQFVGHTANNATMGVANLAQFVGAEEFGNYLYQKGLEGEARLPEMLKPELSLSYITNPNGLLSTTAQVLGSVLSMAPVAALAPVGGIGAGAAAAVSRIPQVGLFASRFVPGAVRWATTGPVEAMMEGGGVEREMLAGGASREAANEAAWKVFRENAGLLTVTNAIGGGLLYGRGIKMPKFSNPVAKAVGAAVSYAPQTAAEMVTQGYEEGVQEGIHDAAMGRGEDSLAQKLNPFQWTEGQRDAAKVGFAGAGPLVGGAALLRRLGRQSGNAEGGGESAETGSEEAQAADAPDGLAARFSEWEGQHMPHGENGCVEAVTRLGCTYSPFLAQELEDGNVSVPQLIQNAGDLYIPFSPDAVERGDVIVYDGDEHVVIADGEGGYFGNSSKHQIILHDNDYMEMDGMQPTGIIKTGGGALTGGTSLSSSPAPISAPTMPDFTGLIADENNIQATQEAVQKLIDTDSFTPEQHMAIIRAAEMARDTPVGNGTDAALEAETVNEWQQLIDRKDVKGIFEKDPQRVTQTIHQLGKEQRAQRTRAVIENQQQIEAEKQALQAAQAQQNVQGMPAQVGGTVQQVVPEQGAAQMGAAAQPENVMQNAQVNQDTAVQMMPPSPPVHGMFSDPVQDVNTAAQQRATPQMNAAPAPSEDVTAGAQQGAEQMAQDAAQPRPRVSQEELLDILSKVQEWEKPLLTIPEYVAARNRQDWDAASRIAYAAGIPGLVQFYDTLMEHGRRNATNITPTAPRQEAQQKPAERTEAPAPVVGVRPNVPAMLPEDLEERRKLSRALGRFMQTNGIPVSPQLRDDLSIGRGKAIVAADKKITAWEEKRAAQEAQAAQSGAVNTAQTAQEGAQGTQNTVQDRMLAQHSAEPQNGSKTVRGKSAQNQGNKKAADDGDKELADGYETESGRPLSEADPKEFIIKPNGSRNFGEITKAVKEKSLNDNEREAVKGLSADAKNVYQMVRDKLSGMKNKAVRRASSVSAVLLARHADIIARKVRAVLGRPFTAMDYYRTWVDLQYGGGKDADGNVYAQRRAEMSDAERKEMQFRIIEETNPMHDDIHTGIRSVDDILTAKEAFETKVDEDSYAYPDFTEADGKAALKNGEVTIYSSYPIAPGVFVTPSKMQAQDYAGGGKIYSKKVSVKDIAWIHSDEGQYAPIETESFNQSAWHGTPHDFDGFDLGAIGTGEGAQVHGWGLYFAQDRKVSEEYKEWLAGKHISYDGKPISAYTGDIHQALTALEKRIQPNFTEDIPTQIIAYQNELAQNVRRARVLLSAIDVELAKDEDSPPATLAALRKDASARIREIIDSAPPLHNGGRRKVADVMQYLRNEQERYRMFIRNAEVIGQQLQHIDSSKVGAGKGKLFEVEIPDNDVLLDEQKKLADQPTIVALLEKYAEKIGDWSFTLEEAPDYTGRDFYKYISDVEGGDKAASEYLNSAGIKGITYDGRRDGRCYVIFDDKAIQIIEKFNQQMNEIVKGTTQDVRDGQRIVSLFEEADESTFLHEMGHLFLLDLERLADMSPTSAEELATVRKWAAWSEGQAEEYKGTPFAAEFAYIDARIRAAIKRGDEKTANKLKRQWEHERFARGFEMYLKHGEAPTKGLRAVFAKFRAFLQRVYQAFTGTGGRATPEVEAVMARMISIEDSSDLSGYPQGKKTAVYTDSGKKISVQYRVVSADDLITSHDANALEVNPGYPAALQPRDRERVMMRQQVTGVANTLRPEDLADARNLNQGAPLIRNDGVVLNGNGRTIAIARAQTRHKERATAYRDYLVENAATFGLSKEDIEGVKNPVLVREVQGDISDGLMQDIIGSTTGGARMGASEAAQQDAEKITYAMLDAYVPNDKGDLTTAANRSFVAGILHKLVGKDEMNAYLDKDGHVNADGIQRVKRALFALAYGDDELIAKMAESTDDDIRNVSNGLMSAAPMVARLSVKKGVPYVKELQDAISDAVKQLDTLRRSGESVKDYLGAQALFTEHEDSAEMRAILSFLDENKRSGKRIAAFFSRTAKTLDELESPSGNELFDTEMPSLMDVLDGAQKYAENGGQEGLFGDNAQEVADAIKKKQSSPMSDAHSPERNVQNDSADTVSSGANISPNEAEGKQEPTLENILQLAPSLKKAALEYGAKDEGGKVTFADEERKQEFLKVAKALLGAAERKTSARRQESLKEMLDGIRLIPPTRVSPRKRVIADWGREMGVSVVFFKGDPSLHGFHQDGVTFLNVDSEITPQWTFWHEAMHWMKANNPDIYNDLVEAIRDAEGFTKEQLDAYRREIGAPEMSDADVIEEMIADALPDVRRRVPLLRELGRRDAGVVQRVVAWIRDVMRRFHDHFHTPKGGLTSAQRVAMTRAFGNLVGSIRDAEGKPIFRVGYEGARIILHDKSPLPDVKYSQSDKSMRWIATHPFKYDESQTMDENIQRAESLAQEYLDTFGTTDQINTPARQKLRREIADKLYGKGAKKKEGKVWLVLGVPASGKSTFSDPLVEREGALLVDSDEAKKLLPEFSNGLLAGAVHEESAAIANDVVKRAVTNKDNLVLPLVGKTFATLQEKIDKLKEAGYEVNLIYVDLPVEKAIERTKARFRHAGRLVSPNYLRKVGLKPRENYDKLKMTEEVDSYEAWDNNVNKGDNPIPLEHSTPKSEQTESQTRLGGRGQHARYVYGGNRSGDSGTQGDGLAVNNTTNRSDNRGGFSMPKFSANTSGESPKGNFKLLKDRIRSLVGVAPANNLELPGRPQRTVTLTPKELERKIKDRWIQEKNIISKEEQKDGTVKVTYYPDTHDVGYADWVKSVRQVAKRNPFVKVLYDLAHKAMKKQEKLRNEFGKALKEFNDLVKNEKDLKSITAILWQGDAEGKAFTDAELRAMGVSENVIKAYKLVRRELDRAYKMLRDAQMQVKTRSQTIPEESVESFKKSHWIEDGDVISEKSRGDGTVLLTWRGGKTYDVKSKTMTSEELDLMKKDENINVTYVGEKGDGTFSVSYVERIKPVFYRKGYMPHFFHEWMVYEKYKDPQTGEERYTSVGSGRTMNEAVRIGNEIAEKNKDKQYVLRPKGFDLGVENSVVIGDVDFAQMTKRIAESTEVSLADARAVLMESAGASLRARHRFFGSLLERKDGKGFDQDVPWVLAHYFNGAARYIAMEEFKPAAISMYERFFGAFGELPKNLTAKFCQDLINDVNGNPRWAELELTRLIKKTWVGKRIADSYGDRFALAANAELSTWNAITKLGLLNFASAAVNFSQFINVGAALNDYGYAGKGLWRAVFPSEMDRKIIEASGLLDDINAAADNGGYTQRRGGRVRGIYSGIKHLGELSLIPFQKADMLMRKAAVLGAYYQGVEQKGMKTAPGDELSAEALAYAQDINDDANFDYSSANAPGMLRSGSVITQQLFQFQKYPIMQFEFMYNIMKNGTRGQKVRMFVPYVLFCGIPASIPFGSLFNQLFSFLFGLATGDDEDIAQEVKAEVLRWAGKDPVKKAIAETALYGILAPTFGLDISGRIGMSNAFGGEFYGAQKPESVAGVIGQQLGGPAANSIYNMFHQFHEGNNIEALKAVSPALGNMAQAAVGESRTTRHRVNARYDTAYDKIAHALGFRSVEESKNAFIMHYEYEQKGKAAQIKREAIQDYIADPSDENRRTINALGITERQIKEARIQQERTALERAREGRPKTSSKSGASRRRKEEAQQDTLYDTLDDE